MNPFTVVGCLLAVFVFGIILGFWISEKIGKELEQEEIQAVKKENSELRGLVREAIRTLHKCLEKR